MTYNTSCDLFPALDPTNYTNLHTQMVDYCVDNLQEIRLEAMEEVQTRYFQYGLYGFLCLWTFCSLISLLIATWRWLTAERKGYKPSIIILYLVSLAIVRSRFENLIRDNYFS